MFIILSSVAKP